MSSFLAISPARVALAFAVVLAAGGCVKSASGDLAASVPPSALSDQDWREQAERWGKRFEAQPGEKTASIHYARALRAIGQRSQAVAVLEQAAARAPNDLELLGAYGRALSDAGKLREALGVLERAHTPERPDWRVLSAQGVVSDKLGDHAAAQRYYETALNIAPDEPSVMSNLGFSYALSRRLPEAEEILRRAAQSAKADARVRQNLVLVLGLQGKFEEAETLARADLAPQEAAQNIAYLKKLVTQRNNWAKIKQTLQR